MSTKSDLQKKVKALENVTKQLRTQLKAERSKGSTVKVTNSRRKKESVPASSIPSWSGGSKPLRIHQAERVATITTNSTAGAFKANSFVINPADVTTFPWLASIAALFDKYKFHSLKFIYINNSPTSVPGNVTLAVDFDTLDATPANGVSMTNLAKFKSFAPWKSEELVIPVNRPSNANWLFTQDASYQAGTNIDKKTYDLGKVFISTEGMAANETAGYLIVEYDVELLDKNPN